MVQTLYSSRSGLLAPLEVGAVHPHAMQDHRQAPTDGNDRYAKLAARLRYAPPAIQLGGETADALTFEPDHPVGAGQGKPSPSLRSRPATFLPLT